MFKETEYNLLCMESNQSNHHQSALVHWDFLHQSVFSPHLLDPKFFRHKKTTSPNNPPARQQTCQSQLSIKQPSTLFQACSRSTQLITERSTTRLVQSHSLRLSINQPPTPRLVHDCSIQPLSDHITILIQRHNLASHQHPTECAGGQRSTI